MLDQLTSSELGTLSGAVLILVTQFATLMDDPLLPELLREFQDALVTEKTDRARLADTPASTDSQAGGQPAAGIAAGGGAGAGGCLGTVNKTRLRPGRLPGHCADAGLPDRRSGPGRPGRRGRRTLGLASPVIRSTPPRTPCS